MKSLRNVIYNWIKADTLTLNVKKTHFMISHRSRMKPVSVQNLYAMKILNKPILLNF